MQCFKKPGAPNDASDVEGVKMVRKFIKYIDQSLKTQI